MVALSFFSLQWHLTALKRKIVFVKLVGGLGGGGELAVNRRFRGPQFYGRLVTLAGSLQVARLRAFHSSCFWRNYRIRFRPKINFKMDNTSSPRNSPNHRSSIRANSPTNFRSVDRPISKESLERHLAALDAISVAVGSSGVNNNNNSLTSQDNIGLRANSSFLIEDILFPRPKVRIV